VNSCAYTIDLCYDTQAMSGIPSTGFCNEDPERNPYKLLDLTNIKGFLSLKRSMKIPTVTAITVPWREEEQKREAAVTTGATSDRMMITTLGWSKEQALETRMRLMTFAEDWEAPGMEGYDDI